MDASICGKWNQLSLPIIAGMRILRHPLPVNLR